MEKLSRCHWRSSCHKRKRKKEKKREEEADWLLELILTNQSRADRFVFSTNQNGKTNWVLSVLWLSSFLLFFFPFFSSIMSKPFRSPRFKSKWSPRGPGVLMSTLITTKKEISSITLAKLTGTFTSAMATSLTSPPSAPAATTSRLASSCTTTMTTRSSNFQMRASAASASQTEDFVHLFPFSSLLVFDPLSFLKIGELKQKCSFLFFFFALTFLFWILFSFFFLLSFSLPSSHSNKENKK